MFMTTSLKAKEHSRFFDDLCERIGDGQGYSMIGHKWFPWNAFPLNAASLEEAFGALEISVICFFKDNAIVMKSESRTEKIFPNSTQLLVEAKVTKDGKSSFVPPKTCAEDWERVFHWLKDQVEHPRFV